jgi:hypothetical protein
MSVVGRIRLAVVAFVALAGALALAAPSGTAVAAATHGTPAHAPFQPTPPGGTPLLLPQGTISSTNWSGYATTGTTYSSVSANWVVPAVTCAGGPGYSASWVGLDGYTSKTVEQTGSESDCTLSSATYYAWYEMYPAGSVNIAEPVSPGDHMSASVTATGDSFALTIKDVTKDWTHTITKTSASAKRSSAEVIEEAPCCTASGGILPLADFAKETFTQAHVDGAFLSASTPTRIDMSAGGVSKDTTSPLNKTGGAFTVTWHHR